MIPLEVRLLQLKTSVAARHVRTTLWVLRLLPSSLAQVYREQFQREAVDDIITRGYYAGLAPETIARELTRQEPAHYEQYLTYTREQFARIKSAQDGGK
jgi:hypothetical protein